MDGAGWHISALGGFLGRAAADVADTVGGANLINSFGEQEEGSQKGDGQSALEKYGPKTNSENTRA